MSFYRHDVLRFIKKLTIRKLWNAGKILVSYYFSRTFGVSSPAGMPFTLSIEPTTACNLRCPECPSGLRSFSRATGNLKSDFFRKSLESLSKDLMMLIFYFQGEPFINPAFLDMVKYAYEKNIYTITSTNGHFLDDETAKKTVESGLDRIIISVDGTTQEVYEQYRKAGSLEKVLEGTGNLVRWKQKLGVHHPHIIFQFLVVRPNEHQIPEIYKLAEELGVNEVRLKTAQIYDYKNGSPLIPENTKYARYRKKSDGTWEVKNNLVNHCWKMWHSAVITWDGMVVPCCFDKDAQHRLGDLKTQDFESIWRSTAYADFRGRLQRGRDQIDICTNCSEGCSVWA